MKALTWNVNGLRAVRKKGFDEIIKDLDCDIIGIQETKMQENQLDKVVDGYFMYFNDAFKKGYSGTCVLSKVEPIKVYKNFEYLNSDIHNDEGRILTLEFDRYFFVTVYVPNSQDALRRIEYRKQFDSDFSNYLNELKKTKHVIVCGDFNVAHEPIDLKNPEANMMNPGFSLEERVDLTKLLLTGFVDVFRYTYPDKVKYSWWSMRFNARSNNAGWRIDYFLVNNELIDRVTKIKILDNIYGSDHCPVLLEVNLD